MQDWQIDAVQKRLMEPADVVVSDLPIGFYPDDEVAKNFEVATTDGHTFAHHLLIEQSFNYLKEGSFAIFPCITSREKKISRTRRPG